MIEQSSASIRKKFIRTCEILPIEFGSCRSSERQRWTQKIFRKGKQNHKWQNFLQWFQNFPQFITLTCKKILELWTEVASLKKPMTMEHIWVEHVSNIFSDAAIYLSFHTQVLLLHSLLQEQVKRAQKFLRLRNCYFRTLDEIIVITVHGFSFSTRDSEEDSSFRKIPNWWRKIGFPAAK